MFGYMTVEKAKAMGFTHHGSYYGVPIYLGFASDPQTDMEEGPAVAVKWMPMDLVFDLFAAIEQFVRPMMFPEDEPVFQFKVGDPL